MSRFTDAGNPLWQSLRAIHFGHNISVTLKKQLPLLG